MRGGLFMPYCKILTLRRYLVVYFPNSKFMLQPPSHSYQTKPNRVEKSFLMITRDFRVS